MCLCQPECIVVVFCVMWSAQVTITTSGSILVRSSSLSATNIAVSYWCLLRASCRQSRRYFSIMVLACTRMCMIMLHKNGTSSVVCCCCCCRCCRVDESRQLNARACEFYAGFFMQGSRLTKQNSLITSKVLPPIVLYPPSLNVIFAVT